MSRFVSQDVYLRALTAGDTGTSWDAICRNRPLTYDALWHSDLGAARAVFNIRDCYAGPGGLGLDRSYVEVCNLICTATRFRRGFLLGMRLINMGVSMRDFTMRLVTSSPILGPHMEVIEEE